MRSIFVYKSRILASLFFLYILLEKWVILSFQLISLYLYLVYTAKRNLLALSIFLLKISFGDFNLFTVYNVLFTSSWVAVLSNFPTLHNRSPFLRFPMAVFSRFLQPLSVVFLKFWSGWQSRCYVFLPPWHQNCNQIIEQSNQISIYWLAEQKSYI